LEVGCNNSRLSCVVTKFTEELGVGDTGSEGHNTKAHARKREGTSAISNWFDKGSGLVQNCCVVTLTDVEGGSDGGGTTSEALIGNWTSLEREA